VVCSSWLAWLVYRCRVKEGTPGLLVVFIYFPGGNTHPAVVLLTLYQFGKERKRNPQRPYCVHTTHGSTSELM
jgi:hypothetical protein